MVPYRYKRVINKAYLVKYKDEIEGFTYRLVSLVNYVGELYVIRIDSTKSLYRTEYQTGELVLTALWYWKTG